MIFLSEKKSLYKNYLFMILFVYLLLYSGTITAQETVEQVLSNSQGYEFDFSHEEQHMNIMIPQGSIGADVNLKFSFNPLTSSFEADTDALRSSLDNLDPELEFFNEHLYELALYAGSEARNDSFFIPLKLEAYYKDTDQDGIVDGSHPMIFEHTLKAYFFDFDNTWNPVEDQEEDFTLNTVTMYISRPGTFALFGMINYSADARHVQIYPGSAGKFNAGGITFDKITNDAEIKIYNLNGELIRELQETDTDGRIVWDAKNAHGRDTVSGVYFAHIKGKNTRKIYCFAIER